MTNVQKWIHKCAVLARKNTAVHPAMQTLLMLEGLSDSFKDIRMCHSVQSGT